MNTDYQIAGSLKSTRIERSYPIATNTEEIKSNSGLNLYKFKIVDLGLDRIVLVTSDDLKSALKIFESAKTDYKYFDLVEMCTLNDIKFDFSFSKNIVRIYQVTIEGLTWIMDYESLEKHNTANAVEIKYLFNARVYGKI